MRDLLRDVIVALRRLRAARAFTVFSVLTLALGIGMTTAIYALVSGTILRPPHIRDIEQVVNIYHSSARGAGHLMWLSEPDIRDLIAAATSFDEIAVWGRLRGGLTTERTSTSVIAEAVSGNYFEFVGARARLGRLLLRADDEASAASAIVVSEQFWRRHLQSDPEILGRVVSLNNVPAEIVGVVALPFQGVDMPNVVPTPLWVPMAVAKRMERDCGIGLLAAREQRRWNVKARLRSGISLVQAQAEVVSVGRQLDQAFPIGTPADRARSVSPASRRLWEVVPASSIHVHESVDSLARPVALLTIVTIILVLLVACTNIANLLLARGVARRSEFALRYALGASRWRIVREQLIESALLSAIACAAAVATARWAVVQLASIDSIRMGPALNMQLTPAANSTVIAAAMVSTAIALLVFGLVPAVHLTRRDLNPSLSANDVTGTARRWRGRRALIASQVAVSAALAAGAVFSAQQVMRSAQLDTGLDLERFAAASIDFRQVSYDEARARETLRRILDTVRRDPHSEVVALSSGLPIGLPAPSVVVGRPGEVMDLQAQRLRYARFLAATPTIFEAIGLRVIRGRPLEDRDAVSNERVAVVSEQLAQNIFGTVDVVGQQLAFRRGQPSGLTPPVLTSTIVGVVEDISPDGSAGRSEPSMYVPFDQNYESTMAIVVRSAIPSDTAVALPEMIRGADAGVAVTDVGTGASLSGIANLPMRIVAGLTGLLGGVALVLAMTGLYGVLSYIVAGRRREIGVRRALGATSGNVLRMIVADGLRPVVVGLLVGSAASAALRIAAVQTLRRVPPIDLSLMLLVPLLFVMAGVLACYLPARHATKVDPSVALRDL